MQAHHWAKDHHRTTLVVHACDTIWWHGPKIEQAARRALVKRSLPRVDAYVAENEMAISQALSAGLDPRAVTETIHTNPRDPSVFTPAAGERERAAARSLLGLPEEGIGIGFLGRLVPEKGPLLLLDALESVDVSAAGDGTPVWAALGGRGPLEEEVRKRTEAPTRFFLNELAYPDEVSTYFRALDVLVVPSWSTPSWEEQSPRVVIEAMMSGCVVVVARSGALPEMVLDAGLTFEERNGADLTRALNRAIDPQYRAETSRRARASAIERYSGPAIADRLFDVWKRSLALRTGAVS
jgi:glycosyltransferase involved in cell wall biosynthesis